MISTSDATTICAGDGQSDPINVALDSNMATNSSWVITDTSGLILGLPSGYLSIWMEQVQASVKYGI